MAGIKNYLNNTIIIWTWSFSVWKNNLLLYNILIFAAHASRHCGIKCLNVTGHLLCTVKPRVEGCQEIGLKLEWPIFWVPHHLRQACHQWSQESRPNRPVTERLHKNDSSDICRQAPSHDPRQEKGTGAARWESLPSDFNFVKTNIK